MREKPVAAHGARALAPSRVERFETVVIGGGQAGLAVGYHLAARDNDFIILSDEKRVGDNWRRRWDSLRLFTPARYSGLPGTPFPAPQNHLADKDEVADYLERYVERHELPVRLEARVSRLSRNDERYAIEVERGGLEMGYGGITLGYVAQPMRLTHLSFQVLLGGGGVTYDVQDIAGMRSEDAPADGFFVMEPSVHGELNVSRFLRFGVGVGYRTVSGASLEGLGDRDLRGASASLTFKLGRF